MKPDNVDSLLQYAQDNDWRVRTAAMEHKNATIDILMIGAQDEDEVVRSAVMKNPNTTDSVKMIVKLHT